MTNFILNEKEFAMVCYQYKTYEKGNIRRTLELIAQYLYQYLGIRKIKIPELLIEYLHQAYPLYKQDAEKWNETCEKIAKRTGGNLLLTLEAITLSEREMNRIRQIPDKVNQRLAFTMACIAKLNNAKNSKNDGWLNLSSKDIFDAAHVTGSMSARDLRINNLYKMGLIDLPKKVNNNNIRVRFLDDDGYSDPQWKYYDVDAMAFRDLGLYYRYRFLHDSEIKICPKCGRYFSQYQAAKRRTASKICVDCIEEQERVKPPCIIKKKCVDCGKDFFVDARANHKTRCDDCQAKWRKFNDKKRKKKPEFSALEKPRASMQK